ncbi:MAG: hypothetical protein K2I64_05180 [Muribaculaceae bacterium]|nr:hypothetical protein [Muribaculaceae bacterium]
MKAFKKTFVALFFLTALFAYAANVSAQTRAYLYQFSVKDGVKVKGGYEGKIWYFTFSPDRSKVYLTDENGVSSSGAPEGIYQGTENGIHVYKGNTPFLGVSYLYFSSDFSRLNWDCIADNLNGGQKIIRVLNYVENPRTANAPTQLY